MEVIKNIDNPNNDFFHAEDIKKYDYVRNKETCESFALRKDIPYQMSRLFHRSLVKFLADKKETGISVANEISTYMDCKDLFDEKNYKYQMNQVLKKYNEQYELPEEYLNILFELTGELG